MAGYLMGLAQYLLSLRWLLNMPFLSGAIAGWLALSAYCAFYPAVWCWLVLRWVPRGKRAMGAGRGGGEMVAVARDTSWMHRQVWALFCACAWVGGEQLRAYLLTGFPWNPLGVSQFQAAPLIQVAAVGGVGAVSLIVVWGSVALLLAVIKATGPARSTWGWAGEIAIPLLVVAGCVGFGLQRLAGPDEATASIKLALVQPNIAQTLIWDEQESERRFEDLLRLSEKALKTDPDLLVWPESAVPSSLNDGSAIARFARGHRIWILFNATEYERTDAGGEARFYNSAFLMNPAGRIVGSARKRHLVIFGEYVPLSNWLPFLKRLTPIGIGFTPGKEPRTLELPDFDLQIGTLICFEDIFARLARETVHPETDLLVNLTNDGWFGQGSAQFQQAANAAFRSIETGVPLVRCTNNGLTCWVDSRGRIHGYPGGSDEQVYAAGFRTYRLPLDHRSDRERPFYAVWGDGLGWACLGVYGGFLLWGLGGGVRRGTMRLRRTLDKEMAAEPGGGSSEE